MDNEGTYRRTWSCCARCRVAFWSPRPSPSAALPAQTQSLKDTPSSLTRPDRRSRDVPNKQTCRWQIPAARRLVSPGNGGRLSCLGTGTGDANRAKLSVRLFLRRAVLLAQPRTYVVQYSCAGSVRHIYLRPINEATIGTGDSERSENTTRTMRRVTHLLLRPDTRTATVSHPLASSAVTLATGTRLVKIRARSGGRPRIYAQGVSRTRI